MLYVDTQQSDLSDAASPPEESCIFGVPQKDKKLRNHHM